MREMKQMAGPAAGVRGMAPAMRNTHTATQHIRRGQTSAWRICGYELPRAQTSQRTNARTHRKRTCDDHNSSNQTTLRHTATQTGIHGTIIIIQYTGSTRENAPARQSSAHLAHLRHRDRRAPTAPRAAAPRAILTSQNTMCVICAQSGGTGGGVHYRTAITPRSHRPGHAARACHRGSDDVMQP